MRSMKTLLRLLGSVSLTTFAASSVVACGSPKPELDVDVVAKLLGWYDANGKSLIEQKLNKDDTVDKEKYSIIVDDSLIKPVEIFKNKLLNSNKAKNSEATKLLADLGFKTGNESKEYSTDDIKKITTLYAKVTSSNLGKIEENGTTDFKVSDGTCQVDIMDKVGNGTKVVKSYTIKTLKNDTLKVPSAVVSIVTTTNLNLTKEKGYVQGGLVFNSLPWKNDKSAQKNLYDSLTQLFGKEELIWTNDVNGTSVITNFPTTGSAYLTIKFENIKVLIALDCGNPHA